MVMAMAIHPSGGVGVNTDHVPKDNDKIDKGRPVVECLVSNSHVDDIREIKSAHEPNKDQVEECETGRRGDGVTQTVRRCIFQSRFFLSPLTLSPFHPVSLSPRLASRLYKLFMESLRPFYADNRSLYI